MLSRGARNSSCQIIKITKVREVIIVFDDVNACISLEMYIANQTKGMQRQQIIGIIGLIWHNVVTVRVMAKNFMQVQY